MKKKILALLLLFSFVAFGLIGCDDKPVIVNVKNNEELNGTNFGESALIEIGNGIYYDSTTRIVYWWNGYLTSSRPTTPSPYYAPNGLPYRYNPETNTFEEIDK